MILTTHTAPELEFLQAKWSAHLSFAAVVDLLRDVLPVDSCLQVETVRRHVFATAERLEAELGPEQFAYDAGCQLEIESSPEPGPPITVGLDGGYIRGRERRPGGTGCFEVIAGKSIPAEGLAKVFAGVSRIDTKPKRRLHEVLQSQGVSPRQHVTFLSDGGDTVRELPAYLHPHSEHVLDWFHIAHACIDVLGHCTLSVKAPRRTSIRIGVSCTAGLDSDTGTKPSGRADGARGADTIAFGSLPSASITQRRNKLALIDRSIAHAAIEASGLRHAATASALNSALCMRRRRRPAPKSIVHPCPLSQLVDRDTLTI